MKKSGKSKNEEEEVLEICRYIKKILEAMKMYTIFIHDSLKMFKRFPILIQVSLVFKWLLISLTAASSFLIFLCPSELGGGRLRRSTW